MANTGYSSPFPTSHDTIGASTLITPFKVPSSPPTPAREVSHSPLDSPVPKSPTLDRLAKHDADDSDSDEEEDRDDARQREIDSPVLSRASSPDRFAMADLDARLAEYSIDFRRLGGDKDDDMLPDMKRFEEEDKVSEVGGPEDLTANLEKYLMEGDDEEERLEKGPDEQHIQEQEHDQDGNEEKEHALEQSEQNSKLQPTENEAELGEYSEFGPPVDMSTPSHLLSRTNSGFAKDVSHLEGIEEDDEMEPAVTPSVWKQRQRSLSNKLEEDKNKDLHRQIADLQQALQDRDEQLEKNHKRVLEAASAGEQIRHLQTELHRQSALLDELRAQRSDEELLREQVQLLQKQTHDKDLSLRNSTMNSTNINALRRQMDEMQKELQNRNPPTGLDAERLDTIAHLRQQLNLSQDQLRKRDATLDETMAKLREVTTAKEQQLREKNKKIDGLRAQIDDQTLEIEKLETEVDRANTDYQTLESRIVSLETQNGPLEERNSTLEADLTRTQTQVTAQENALKAMAADLPSGAGGQETFTEILDLIKDLGPPEDEPENFIPGARSSTRDYELEYLRQEVGKLQNELNEKSQSEKTLTAELARSREQSTETQSLFKSIEGENTRLTKRADELKSNMDRVQRELQKLRIDHSAALQTIERLQQDDNTFQQPSPPPSPPVAHTHGANTNTNTHPASTTVAALETSHQAQLKNFHSLLSAAEKRESRLRSELQSLHSAQDLRLESLATEVQRLQFVIAVKDETAAAMDGKIARSVEKREKEWERRVDLLLKERDRMGKALLWTWGEKEVADKENVYGEDGRKVRQGYRYKYANAQRQGRN